MMIRKVLDFVRDQEMQAQQYGGRFEYGRGYLTALLEVEEYIAELMWDNGVDADDEAEST